MAYKKGESGNPAGRPPGTNPATKVRKDIETALPELVASIIQRAKDGDMTAAKILIDRVCPTLKPQALPVTVHNAGNTDLSVVGQNIINSTLSGGISPDIGAMLMGAIANQAKLVEIDDLTKRIELLEEKQK